MTEFFKKTDKVCKMSFMFGFFSGIAILSLIIFIFLFILILGNYKATAALDKTAPVEKEAAAAPTQEAAPAQPVSNISPNEYIRGNKDAKVEFIEYSDFECPYCQRNAETVEKIYQEYKDKIKMVFRHFPLSFHAQAQKAAEASECAGEQGKFWEMHDKIFADNKAKTMSVDKWKEEAKNLKLDTAKFNDCLDSGKYAAKIAQVQAEAESFGVTGTPAMFINKVLISGAQPYEVIKAEIDKNLQ